MWKPTGHTLKNSTTSTVVASMEPFATGQSSCARLSSMVELKPCYVANECRFTAPGGWAEFTDLDCLLQSPDNSVAPDSALATHNKNFNAMAEKMGCETRPAKHLEKWVTDAGFTDLKVKRCPLPMGTWAKDRHLVS